MTDIDVSRAAVERLLTGVTKGPWLYRPGQYDDWGVVKADDFQICQARHPDRLEREILNEYRAKGLDPWEANARFIAAARELVPALLARAEAAEAERDRYFNGGARYLQDYADTLVQLASAQSRAESAETALAAERETVARLTEALKIETGEKLDAISTLDAWFDRRKLGHEAVDQAVVDAASGYLRTSRVGGMEQAESDLILGVIQDMARLGLFADLFARATLIQKDRTDPPTAGQRLIAAAAEAALSAERETVARLTEALRLLHDSVVQAFPSLANLGPVAAARAALLTGKPVTEYQRKVAQMKEDFPNGI